MNPNNPSHMGPTQSNTGGAGNTGGSPPGSPTNQNKKSIDFPVKWYHNIKLSLMAGRGKVLVKVIWNELIREARHKDETTLYILHNQEEVDRVAAKMAEVVALLEEIKAAHQQT